MTTTPTLPQLQRGLQIAEQIDALEKELAGILGNPTTPVAKATSAAAKSPAKAPAKKQSTMSVQGIANIKAAQKKRWAKIKAAKKATPPAKAQSKAPAPVKKKPAMSAEAKAKLSAMMKARWEAKKAASSPAPAATEAPAPAETATEQLGQL